MVALRAIIKSDSNKGSGSVAIAIRVSEKLKLYKVRA